MSAKLNLKVGIMDRKFTVACEEDERDDLLAAAAHLDRQMRAVQQSGRVIGHERCAIIAALNIANELLSGGRAASLDAESLERVDELIERVRGALDRHRNPGSA